MSASQTDIVGLTTISGLQSHHVGQLHTLYQQEWWTRGRSLRETERVVDGSHVCLGIVDGEDALVAFARVLTDGVFKALIFDVIVADRCRGLQLGRRLLEEVKAHPRLTDIRHFELYCLPELAPFYAKFGFSTDVGGVRLMRCNVADDRR
jgi:GNAT superfamily N-acetyltransferase